MRRLGAAGFALLGLVATVVGTAAPIGAAPQEVGAAESRDGVIARRFIVVLKSGDPGTVANQHRRDHGAEVTHVYRTALRGYAASMSPEAAARVARDSRVDYVDEDRVVTTAHHQCGHVVRGVEGPCDDPVPTDPQPGTLSGTVTSGGIGLEGATVTIEGISTTASTGSEGKYAFDLLEANTYTVTASKADHVPETKSVTIDGDKTLDFSLALETTTSRQPIPWGVARVDAPLTGNTGTGIHVYVIDTGIDLRHADLNVAAQGFASEECKGGGCLAAWDDDHGHGTHVAGTIGAIDNDIDVVGVAPGVTLHAVKVLSKRGSGTRSGVIAGVDWVASETKKLNVATVANMSLSGSGSKTGTCTSTGFTGSTDSYHQAICNATRAGVVFAVAAGNGDTSATTRVPAAYDDTVLTVSATSKGDDWPYWSNYGEGSVDGIPTASAPVAIAAPGVSILSTRAGGGTTTMSGTSMAAPHVAGGVALFLKKTSPAATYTAFESARTDLTGSRAEVTTTWANTSGNPHVERFLQVTGL